MTHLEELRSCVAGKGNSETTIVPVQLLLDVINEVEQMRKFMGAMTSGPTFLEITRSLERRSTEPPDPK